MSTISLLFPKVTNLLIPILYCRNASLWTYPSFRECPSIGFCDVFKEAAAGLLILQTE